MLISVLAVDFGFLNTKRSGEWGDGPVEIRGKPTQGRSTRATFIPPQGVRDCRFDRRLNSETALVSSSPYQPKKKRKTTPLSPWSWPSRPASCPNPNRYSLLFSRSNWGILLCMSSSRLFDLSRALIFESVRFLFYFFFRSYFF